MCKDKRVRYLAIKYVVVNGKKQDNVLATRSMFSTWVDPQLKKTVLLLASYSGNSQQTHFTGWIVACCCVLMQAYPSPGAGMHYGSHSVAIVHILCALEDIGMTY